MSSFRIQDEDYQQKLISDVVNNCIAGIAVGLLVRCVSRAARVQMC